MIFKNLHSIFIFVKYDLLGPKSPLEIVNKPKSISFINIVLQAQSELGIF